MDLLKNQIMKKIRFGKKTTKRQEQILILAINPNELRQIKNCVTSNGIWKKLKELYESKGPARKATLLKQLIMSKMNEGETMKNHLNNFFLLIFAWAHNPL
jgi:hypothetical protein